MPLTYDNLRAKYGLPEEAHELPTGKTKTKGFWRWKKTVPETVLETREQTRERLTGEIVKTLEDALGKKLMIDGLQPDQIKSASGKFYIIDEPQSKIASIDYSCGSFVPDSQLEPKLSRDAGVELIVAGDVLNSKDKYDALKSKLNELSAVGMDLFLHRESGMLREVGLQSTYPVSR